MSEDAVVFKHAFCPECGPVTECDEDRCCLTCGADTIVGEAFDELMAAKENAEAALCRAREALDSISTDIICYGPGCIYCEDDEKRHPSSGVALRAQATLHSIQNSASCPHADELVRVREEVKRLQQEMSIAIASAKAMVSNELMERLEVIYKEEIVGCTGHEVKIMTDFTNVFRELARENRNLLDAELRRRSSGGE